MHAIYWTIVIQIMTADHDTVILQAAYHRIAALTTIAVMDYDVME